MYRMQRLNYILTLILFLFILSNCKMKVLTNIPNSKGLSAPFATVLSDDRIIVAGGCNFPDKPVSEGGKKVYYDEVYLFDKNEWSLIGNLPKANAYGASAIYNDKLICIGGMNENGSFTDVFSISVNANKDISIESMPSLPHSIDNANAFISNDFLYIAGGNQTDKKNHLFALDLKNPVKFEDLGIVPSGNRIQSIILAKNNKVYIIGGFNTDNDKITLFDDILIFDTENKTWNEPIKIASNNDGEKRCFVGGSGVVYKDKLLLSSGVNYNIFERALSGEYGKNYLLYPIEWYKFNQDLLAYDINSNSFDIIASYENFARAGAVMSLNNDKLYIICGELKPGIRSSEISLYNLK